MRKAEALSERMGPKVENGFGASAKDVTVSQGDNLKRGFSLLVGTSMSQCRCWLAPQSRAVVRKLFSTSFFLVTLFDNT